jgi:8-amino-7-oxononanoate synthase
MNTFRRYPPLVDSIKQQLDKISNSGLLRELIPIDGLNGTELVIKGRKSICFCSNDYLGFSQHPDMKKAQLEASEIYGTGSCGSRLVCGQNNTYETVERMLVEFKMKGDKRYVGSLIFSSGYLANLSVISSLLSDGDVVFSDELNHASIIDGCRLSGAKKVIYPHLDIDRLRNLIEQHPSKNKMIVTESLFSMDGDIAPVDELAEVAMQYGCILMVDESHAFGVLGEGGRGLLSEDAIKEGYCIQMATFSKALGCVGGFVIAHETIIKYLLQRARGFIFSTALPPVVLWTMKKSIELLQLSEKQRVKLFKNVHHLLKGLKQAGIITPECENFTPIIPIMVGSNEASLSVSSKLLEKYGVFSAPIRPPTVPEGKSRLRFTVTALHTREHIQIAVNALRELLPSS